MTAGYFIAMVIVNEVKAGGQNMTGENQLDEGAAMTTSSQVWKRHASTTSSEGWIKYALL